LRGLPRQVTKSGCRTNPTALRLSAGRSMSCGRRSGPPLRSRSRRFSSPSRSSRRSARSCAAAPATTSRPANWSGCCVTRCSGPSASV